MKLSEKDEVEEEERVPDSEFNRGGYTEWCAAEMPGWNCDARIDVRSEEEDGGEDAVAGANPDAQSHGCCIAPGCDDDSGW